MPVEQTVAPVSKPGAAAVAFAHVLELDFGDQRGQRVAHLQHQWLRLEQVALRQRQHGARLGRIESLRQRQRIGPAVEVQRGTPTYHAGTFVCRG